MCFLQRIKLRLSLSEEFLECHCAHVAFGTLADGERAVLGLFRADYEHVGDFLELRVADFFAELFIARVYLDADARFAELRGGLVGALDVVLRDWRMRACTGASQKGKAPA